MEHAKILRLAQAVVFLDYCAVGAMRTVLPYCMKSLGATGASVGGLETLYGVGQVAGAVALGWVSDAAGRKAVLILSFIGAAVGYSIASLAVASGSVLLLLASRLPVGLAKQTVTATRAIVSDLTPPEGRSAPLARLFAGCSLGYAVGPYLGGLLADRAGSASPLPAAACASVFVLLVPAVTWLLPETSRLAPQHAPLGGASERAPANKGAAPPEQAPAELGAGRSTLLLLLGCTLPEGALVMFASTSLPLLGHRLGWSASQLGLYNSAWGVGSGALSLSLWPWLLASGRLGDVAALRLGVGCLGATCMVLAVWSASAAALWAVLPLGTVAVGMIRIIPAALLTRAAPPAERGRVLGRLDAAGSLCRIVLPAASGALADRAGLWASFASQAALCLAGLVLIECWWWGGRGAKRKAE